MILFIKTSGGERKITEQIFQYEEAVLFIVQEYLNKNRYFTIEEIIPFINSRLRELSISLNFSGIKEILKSLIKKKLIFERSKLSKDQVLDNENRKMIIDYIRNNPGVYFNQIAKELNLSNYLLGWHLKILLKFNFIRNKKFDKHEVFFDVNQERNYDELYYFISKEKSRLIIEYLLENPEGATKTQLSRELLMHSNTISKYLKRLEKLNLLQKKKFSIKTLYFLNEQMYYRVFNN
ncbi:MAG: winged helix-turn-helix transcriptional regulator [Promethearchaeota archaeon]